MIKAMRLHGRGSNAALAVLAVVGFSLILVGLFTDYKAIGFGGSIGGLVGYIVVLYLLIPFNAKRQYRQNRSLRHEISMSLSDQGIEFKSESGTSKLQWTDIHKWKYANGVFLLYITSNMFHVVPLTALPNETELLKLLNENIGPKK
jgi:hypothetical protein